MKTEGIIITKKYIIEGLPVDIKHSYSLKGWRKWFVNSSRVLSIIGWIALTIYIIHRYNGN